MINSIELRIVKNKNGTKKLQYRCLQFEEVADIYPDTWKPNLTPKGWSEWLDFPAAN